MCVSLVVLLTDFCWRTQTERERERFLDAELQILKSVFISTSNLVFVFLDFFSLSILAHRLFCSAAISARSLCDLVA